MRSLLALLALTLPLSAQTQVWVFPGTGFDYYGLALDGGVDIDGDGHDDVLVGGYRANGFSGIARVWSGATGTVIHEFNGASGQRLGEGVAGLVDLDGDGHDDFAISQGSPALTRIFSGQTGLELFQLPKGGASLAAAGDQDGDGTVDILAGDVIFSGADQGVLASFPGAPLPIFRIAPDVDGDGRPDVIRSLFGDRADVYSGFDASLLWTIDDPNIVSVEGIGDVDGDGRGDLSVHALGADTRILSGATAMELYTVPVQVASTLPGPVADAFGDVDADGYGDFLLSGNPGAVLVSGRSGCILAHFPIDVVDGLTIASAGDVDQDGQNEIAIGDPLFTPLGTAAAAVFEYDGPVGISQCVSDSNSTGEAARITAVGSAAIAANDLTFHALPLPPGQPGIFYFGDQAQQVPFGNGTRCVGGSIFRFSPVISTAAGCLTYPADLTQPPLAGLMAGDTRIFQAWYRDPAAGGAAFDLSDALGVAFQ